MTTFPSGTRVASTTVNVSVDPDSLTDVLLLVSVTVHDPIGFLVVTSLSQDIGEAPVSQGLGGLHAVIGTRKAKIRNFQLRILKIKKYVDNL
jgi:hypothetical protein